MNRYGDPYRRCQVCQADQLWTPRGIAEVLLGAVVLLAVWGAMGAAYAMALAASPTVQP
jgi:hypothetical protein